LLYWLDAHDEIANFHLVLLLEVSKYLGFYPDTSDIDMFFEMTEGFYTFSAMSSLTQHETSLFKNLDLKLDNDQKSRYRKTAAIKDFN
jgi:DNA repair protein RecO (recombination protein O)